MSETIELKPFPFCGGEAYANWWAGYAHGECEECGACGEDVKPHENETMEQTEVRAIDAWNTRTKRTCRWKRYEPADAWETECGEMLTWAPEGFPPYCPNCGRKVIDDE